MFAKDLGGLSDVETSLSLSIATIVAPRAPHSTNRVPDTDPAAAESSMNTQFTAVANITAVMPFIARIRRPAQPRLIIMGSVPVDDSHIPEYSKPRCSSVFGNNL
jgi:hypothetical protein